jgi:hypothetical protein
MLFIRASLFSVLSGGKHAKEIFQMKYTLEKWAITHDSKPTLRRNGQSFQSPGVIYAYRI